MAKLTILHLYPKTLRLNGESGNVLALKLRAENFGTQVRIQELELGQSLPKTRPDIVFIGSGIMSATVTAAADLAKKDNVLHQWIKQGTKLLAVGSGFDLVSQSLVLLDGTVIQGLGLTNTHHKEAIEHFVGEVELGSKFAGFVNSNRHIIRADNKLVIGEVTKSDSKSLVGYVDGYRDGKVWASNIQGPLLPMNPSLADEILAAAGVTVAATSATKKLDKLARDARKAISVRVNH